MQVLCARSGGLLTRWDPLVELPKASLRLASPAGHEEPLRWTQQGWQLQACTLACRDRGGVVHDCKINCRHGTRERVLLALNFG